MKIRKILVLIGVIALFFTGCKNVPEEIIGTWTFQTFDDTPQGAVTWTFKDDGQLIRVSTASGDIQFDSCNYVVDKSMLKTQITISNSKMITGFDDLNGIYRIDKFKNDILIMTRIRLNDDEAAGSYLRCEMIRKN
jgi:hypothetical protein